MKRNVDVNYSPAQSRETQVLCGALIALTALRAVFIFVDAPAWWGLNLLAFCDSTIAMVVSAIAFILLYWVFAAKVNREKSGTRTWNMFGITGRILVPVAAGVLFATVQIPIPLLGDAALFWGDLYRTTYLGQALPLYHEPLTMWLNEGVFTLLVKMHHATNMHLPFQITDAFFGVVFVVAAQWIAGSLRGSTALRTCAFLLLLSCGGVLLFFGYIENYAPQYALVLLYFASVLRLLRSHGGRVLPVVLFVLCCLLHLQNIVLAPSLVVAWMLSRSDETPTTIRRIALVMAGAIPALLLIYAYFQWRPVAALSTGDNPFIPFLQLSDTSYTLLSATHLNDLLQEHFMLASVPLVIIIALVVLGWREIKWNTPEMFFFFVATFGLEAFLIGGNLGNGLGRDWDVVCVLGPAITMIAALLLEQAERHNRIHGRTYVAVGVIAALWAGVWVDINIGMDSQIVRYTPLLEYYRPTVKITTTRYGYENLRKMYFARHLWNEELAIDSIMIHTIPWHFDLQRAMTIPMQGRGLDRRRAETVGNILDDLIHSASDSALLSETAGDENNVRIAKANESGPKNLADLIVIAADDLCFKYQVWTKERAMLFTEEFVRLHPAVAQGGELKVRLAAGK